MNSLPQIHFFLSNIWIHGIPGISLLSDREGEHMTLDKPLALCITEAQGVGSR